MTIGVLGPVMVTDEVGRAVPIAGRKARAVLALLAIRANRVVPVEQLEDELWCGTPPAGARATVHAHVSRLRTVLRQAGPSAELVTSGCGYLLVAPPDDVDSTRFEMRARAGATVAATSPSVAASSLTRALEEWRGAAFQDLHDVQPLFLEAQRLEELRLVAVEERWAAELELGGHLLAIGQLQRLAVDHPFREGLQRLLLLALHRAGRRTEALRAYRVAAHALVEIGLTPGSELRLLEQRIATEDPLLSVTGPTVPAAPIGEPRKAESFSTAETDSHAMRALASLTAAVEHSCRAGDEALARRAHGEAIEHYRRALSTLDVSGVDHHRRRTELLLACGRASHAAYELTDAVAAFRLAARSASSIGDVALLTEAASELAFVTEFAMADDDTVELLVQALRAVPLDSARRVDLLAGLARTMPRKDQRGRSHAAAAVALARRLDDPRALTIALATWVLVTWGPRDPASRLTAIDEVIALGGELAWSDMVAEARNWRAATLLQLGRPDEAAADAALVDAWGRRSGRPFFVALAAMRRISDLLDQQRLDDAEDALANPPGGAQTTSNFAAAAAAQLFLLRIAQGRAGELVTLIEPVLDDGEAPFAWRAAHVLALVRAEDHRATAALHSQVAAVRAAPRDWLWLSAVTLLADACVALGDRRSAPSLARALRHHHGETVVVAHGIATLGPVSVRLDALQRLARGGQPDRKEPASVS
jgi:DNA-binding SARP family transcriptional activator